MYDEYSKLIIAYPNDYNSFLEKCREQNLTVLTINQYRQKVNALIPAKARRSIANTTKVRTCCGGGRVL